MLNTTAVRRFSLLLLLATFFCAAVSRDARAQGFISPMFGYNFGGDAGCPEITNCDDKAFNWGVGVGALGAIFGAELEFAYTDQFFGEAPNQDSSVLTLMGNVLLAPKFGPVQPYGLAGLGLIKTSVDLTPSAIINEDNNNFGWDVGGGLMIFFGNHFGIRGDVRYYHAFQALKILGLPIENDSKLDFGRAAGGVVFKF
jgi:opacity protein-like surface antigen